jgi:hypothetical protein
VSDSERNREQLLASLSALGERATPGEDCPAPERIWGTLRAELPVEERRLLVDHLARCLSCAEAWRLAIELDPEPRPVVAPQPSFAALFVSPVLIGVAATLVLTLAAGVLLWRGPEDLHEPSYREASLAEIRSLLPENEPVSRANLRLRWSAGPEGSRYEVRVTTESLEAVTSAEGLREAALLVPESSLQSLPPGSRLLWQVQMRLPDGERRDSPTFVTLLR